MYKSKTGILILTILAAMFFLFVAILFGSSSKRQDVIDRKAALEEKLSTIAQMDITIYWIGEFPTELETLAPVTQVIPSESASSENLPVKSTAIHITERDAYGNIINEEIPRNYSRYMIIIICSKPVFSNSGKEALVDSIAKNGVPVIAIGNDAADFLDGLLMHRRFKEGPGSSLYYCLGKGYKENPIPEDKVLAGGMDFAEAVPDIIDLGIADYTHQ